MTLRSLLTQTVTVQHHAEGAVDRFNDPTGGFDAGTEYRARLEQSAGDEQSTDRSVQVGEWLLILPRDAVIGGRDRVVADGSTFEVVGPPVVQRTPRGPHHIEARLRLVDAG